MIFTRLPGGFTIHLGQWCFGCVLTRTIGVIYTHRFGDKKFTWDKTLWPRSHP